MRLQVAAATHRGAVRHRNEDAVLVGTWIHAQPDLDGVPAMLVLDQPGPAVVAVADGMGGHASGDVASALVLTTLSQQSRRLSGAGAGSVLGEAHVALHAHGLAHPEDAGAGSTVAGLSFGAGTVTVFNVGDSRAYRILDGYAGQLSIDDRPPRMPGQPEGVATTTLTQCLGGVTGDLPQIHPHIGDEPTGPGDRFLLCSDGLHDVLPSQMIGDLAQGPILAAVQRLIAAALEHGAPDNVSVVLAQVLDADQPPLP